MRTARRRRAAGGDTDAFCDCGQCVYGARMDLQWLAATPIFTTTQEREGIAALLRALVIQTLLDPATWARPAGWRP